MKVRLFAILGGKFLDDNQECKNAGGKRKIDRFEGEGTSDVAANNNRGSTVESLDDIEEGTYWNRLPVSEDSNSCTQGALTASERANGSGSAAENLNVKVKGVDQFESFSSAAAADDSCRFPAEEFQPVLCKAGFSVITKVEDAANSDLKNYSQTLLRALSAVDVFVNMFQEQNKFGSASIMKKWIDRKLPLEVDHLKIKNLKEVSELKTKDSFPDSYLILIDALVMCKEMDEAGGSRAQYGHGCKLLFISISYGPIMLLADNGVIVTMVLITCLLSHFGLYYNVAY
ncbi:unnamed protein product [Dovyalis caffra]|uniref:Uncharacterized protein n=1 Tax=Dovyalis caffra TaxID=77055 RepID=A0AAV1QN73_9ROSI|nr:unnamed protein product [Dovyalis caffra]